MTRPEERGAADRGERTLDYGEPVVSDLGSIADLTLGTGGSSPDGNDSTFEQGGQGGGAGGL